MTDITSTTPPPFAPPPLVPVAPAPETPPDVAPAIEAPATPSPPSAGSVAPAAAAIVPPVAAAAVLDPVAAPVAPVPVAAVVAAVKTDVEIERANLLGDLHHILGFVADMGAGLEAHAMAAAKSGDAEVHAGLSRLATLFGEFRMGLLTAGRDLPAKLAADAAGLVAKSKA
jgi:hypothetical protein